MSGRANDWEQEQLRAGRPVVAALCCECGATRKTTTLGRSVGDVSAPGDAAAEPRRCIVRRRCANCRRTTEHAYLRTDAHRDRAEQADRARFDARREARQRLNDAVEQLRACEVRVYWPRDGWAPDERAELVQYLDDGTYVVRLNPAVPYVEQLRVLEQVWTSWLEPNSADWHVESAKPDDPGSLPVRVTTFLAVDQT